MKVLIVDDEAPVREICARTLRGLGLETASAASGDEALGRLVENWDIIITDMTMPGSANGLEVLRRAKAAGSADVLMMTAQPEVGIAIQALKLGAYDFIVKPFSPDVLGASVQRCIDKRLLSVELAREKALRVELARMQKVEETFGIFVTPEVADYVLSLPDGGRKGVRRRVTVLFADVRRFTPFAESVPPETTVETLNSIFSCVVSAVQKEGGILNKFMGDGLLALFGAPLDLIGHERAAARAALASIAAVERLAESTRASGRTPLQIGISLNTGDVVAGCLGAPNRTEYGVIGHAVNVAARFNDEAKPGQILLGRQTAKALGDQFRCRELEPLSLAGVSEPVSPWELLGAVGAASKEPSR